MRNDEPQWLKLLATNLLKKIQALQQSLHRIGDQTEAIAHHHDAENSPARQNEPRNVVISDPGLPVAIPEYYAAENQARPSRSKWDKIKTVAEIGGLIVLTAYVIATWKTLKQIEKQTPAVIDAAQAAKSAAETARRTLDSSIEASRIDQRAWVSIINLHLTREPTAGQDVLITFALPNGGKTPAVDVSLKYVIDIGPKEPVTPDWPRVAKGNQEFIFPNTTLADLRATTSGITQAIVTSYNNRSSRLYVRIHIDYADVFGTSHWSEICSSHSFGDDLGRFEGCPNGAEIDRQH